MPPAPSPPSRTSQARLPLARIALVLVALAWAASIAAALTYQFGPDLQRFGFPTREGQLVAGHAASSIGRTRHDMLVAATRKYADERSTVAVASGSESAGGERSARAAEDTLRAYAPKAYLNRELERQGATWRVRKVDGLNASIYEISG